MQKTNFTFEILINDDASTDKTADIIREYEIKYPGIIKPIYQIENQYSKGVGPWEDILFPIAKGKYIALCEGDDYWTDSLKLQKQVDFLEKNPDFSLCYTKCKNYVQDKDVFVSSPFGNAETFDELLLQNTIPTLTVLLKTNMVFKYLSEIQPKKYKWKMGDYPMWLWFSNCSKIKFLDVETGVYRELSVSACHEQDIIKSTLFRLNVAEVQIFFAEKYSKSHVVVQNLSNFYFEIFHLLYANYYKGNLISTDLASLEKRLHCYSFSNMSFLNKIRLWGLSNLSKYKVSQLIIKSYHRLKGL
jgi:glycosyltransferase involved in cell wall biosynthesis